MTSLNCEKTEIPPKTSDPVDGESLGTFVLWMCVQARRVIVFVIGSTVLLIGIAMILLPGPATIVIPVGLAILATEFVWARRWLKFAKRQIDAVTAKAMEKLQRGNKPEL